MKKFVEIVFFREELPNWLSNTKWLALKVCAYKCLYMNLAG